MSYEMLLLSAGRVELYTSDPAPSSWTAGWWLTIAGCVVVLAISVTLSWLAWRDRTRGTAQDSAFRAMVRKLTSGREDEQLLRRLAGLIEAPPVALVVSESAFVRAIEAAEAHPDRASRLSESEKRRVLTLRAGLFGG